MYKAIVTVTLRPSILDPQGKAVQHALHDLGHGAVRQVRMGKHIELLVEAGSAEEAERVVREASAQLLANPVMEDFTVRVEAAAEAAPAA
ncbi:MAG TPA: phosphoribosylformylglycinamidine synthase subunit PurS [Rubricoccaceae bacterium]|nr:phosphoribosylformylglycinamidine synthase subunit PurS [Rubricoccaceae bacterium]